MTREPFFVSWEGRSARELFPGVRAQVVSGEKLMLARVQLDPGSVVPVHQHPHEQFGFVMEGEVDFNIGDEHRHLRVGDYYAIPGNVPHKVEVGAGGAVCLDIFGPPREEYR